MKRFLPAIGLLALVSFITPGCSSNDDDDPAALSYTQVERLGRPAINEGLFHTNDFLNAVNSVGPGDELGALLPGGVPSPLGLEAIATLDALDLADGVEHITATEVVTALIPDVMRIDTTGVSGYDAGLNSVLSPVRGRKITDDVVDITYSLLISRLMTPFSDGVSYAGVAGNEAQPGHKPVLGAFPYLPKPN